MGKDKWNKLLPDVIYKGFTKIDSKSASILLKINDFPDQRKLNQDWVDYLGRRVEKGTFTEEAIISIVKLSESFENEEQEAASKEVSEWLKNKCGVSMRGRLALLNAQQVLSMIATKEIETDVILFVRDCSNRSKPMRWASVYFAAIDTNRSRSFKQLAKVEMGSRKAYDGIPEKYRNRIASAIRYYDHYISGNEKKKVEFVESMGKFDNHVPVVYGIYRGIIQKSPDLSAIMYNVVLTCIIATLGVPSMSNREKAENFWERVRTDQSNGQPGQKQSPAFKVREFLMRQKDIGSGTMRKEIIGKVCDGWSHFLHGEKIHTLHAVNQISQSSFA